MLPPLVKKTLVWISTRVVSPVPGSLHKSGITFIKGNDFSCQTSKVNFKRVPQCREWSSEGHLTSLTVCLWKGRKLTTVCLLGSSSFVYHHSSSQHLSADTGFSAVLGAGDINNSKILPLPLVLTFSWRKTIRSTSNCKSYRNFVCMEFGINPLKEWSVWFWPG